MIKSCFAFIAFVALTFASLAQPTIKPHDARLQNFEYPFPVQTLELNIQQQKLEMAYMDVRPTNANGKTVLLMHGKNFSGAYWEQTANALVANGYRVIIPDQIGFGKSSKPQHFQYSFHLLAQNTKTLLDSLGVARATVIGHSMGGMLATRFALMYDGLVEKLVLVNPIGLEDYKSKVPYQSIDKVYEQELKQNYEQIKKYQLGNYYDNKWKPEYDRWVNMLAGWTLHADYPMVAWNAALTQDMIMTQPVVYEFGNLKSPTLLIIGLRDRTALGKNLVSEDVQKTMGDYPTLGKATQQKIKNSSLVELDGVGHLPHVEAFDRFIKPLLDFLNE